MALESHLPLSSPSIPIFFSPILRCSSIIPGDNMSRNGKGQRVDMKVNLPARGNTSRRVANDDDDNNDNNNNNVSPNFSSSPSSCVSSEAANSPEATSMVLAGCPRCLMYVMLAEEDPRCPKCKSTVLLDFLNNNNNNSGSSSKKNKSKKR